MRGRKRAGISALLLALAGAAFAACPACNRGAPDRPNVLLISLDSTRRDLLGAYGRRPAHAPERSPSLNLDRLADEGILFEDALATSSWTLPSHVSLMTGEPELVHGVDLDGQRFSDRLPTLAGLLAEAGYRTAGFFSGPYLDPIYGFGRGFARYEACYGPDLTRAAERARDAATAVATAAGEVARAAALAESAAANRALEVASHRDRSSEAVTAAVLAELDRAAEDGRPFFVFAHYFDPHYDYAPPTPYDTAFDPEYEGDHDGTDFIRDPSVATFDPGSPSGRRRVIGQRDLEHLIARYEGELAWTDAQIGRLLDGLAGHGVADDTIVVVLADHGDEFFEHGGIGHRRTLFEEVLRVPLIVRLPGGERAGERVAHPVSLCDVAPTVLDAVGLSIPRTNSGGRSLLDPEAGDALHARGVLSRLVRHEPVEVTLETEVRDVDVEARRWLVLESYRVGSLKITREHRRLHPLAPLPPLLAEAFEDQARDRELLRWVDLAAHPEERPEDHRTDFETGPARDALRSFRRAYEDLAGRRAPPAPAVETEDEHLRLLRGLGYVESASDSGAAGGQPLVLPPPGAAILGEPDGAVDSGG